MKYPIKDLEILADLYESEAYKVYKKYLLDRRRMLLLENSLNGNDISDVKYFRGGVDHIDWSKKEMRQVLKEANQLRAKRGVNEEKA